LALSLDARAREFYRLAQTTLPAEDRRAMMSAGLMGTVYWRLLERIEQARFNVFADKPIRLSKARKIAIAGSAWVRHLLGGAAHGYAATP
jgi:phytoene/squalene synthetase